MGSSVFHGGFSTFLAISVIGASNSYIFMVFYKLWFGIIIFGMANGFLLLPVILSFIGPLTSIDTKMDRKSVKLPKKNLEMVQKSMKRVRRA